MATRKKTKKKSPRSKKSAGSKARAKRPAQKRRTLKKVAKKVAKRKAVPKKATARKKAQAKSTTGKTRSGIGKNRRRSQGPGSPAFSRESSGLQSGDLQGLSNVENVDSESVGELMEEGNAFEAGIVSGVERSRERDGKEVRTRQVPEDDVPGEYLDEE